MIQYDPHRWLDHFFDIRGSLVREISGRVFICVAWSVVIVTLHRNGYALGIPSLVHTLVGLALGLLLVFRTNASYDRYWEGRRLWGGIVNDSRNLVRLAVVHMQPNLELLRSLVGLAIVYPRAVMNFLRSSPEGMPDTLDLLPDQLHELRSASHPPLLISVQMTRCIAEAHRQGLISDITMATMDRNINALVDHLGGCERIRNTPLPFAYVVHLRRAMVIYCLSLPFALVESFGWTTIIDTLFLSYVFFGIEEIGVEIEGPFGTDDNDLPLEVICETIKRNLSALTNN